MARDPQDQALFAVLAEHRCALVPRAGGKWQVVRDNGAPVAGTVADDPADAGALAVVELEAGDVRRRARQALRFADALAAGASILRPRSVAVPPPPGLPSPGNAVVWRVLDAGTGEQVADGLTFAEMAALVVQRGEAAGRGGGR